MFLLAAVILLWGVNWPVMKVGLAFIPPLWFAAARVLLGAACLFAILAALGRLRLPGRTDLPLVVSVGLLQIGLFLGLVNLGLQHVDAGRSAILAYTTPLWVVPIASVVLGEQPNRVQTLALVLGAGGIAVLFNPHGFDFSDPRTLTGNMMLLAGAISWAVCIVHIRKHRWQLTPLQLMPWQMLLAGAALAVVATVTEPLSLIDWSTELALVMAYNGPIASAFCFWAYVTVARTLPAITTALGSLGVPVVGVVSSALMLGESLSVTNVVGLSLIIGSVAILRVRPGS
jgi:drug/metabolite transporter (DMT)-like permease